MFSSALDDSQFVC